MIADDEFKKPITVFSTAGSFSCPQQERSSRGLFESTKPQKKSGQPVCGLRFEIETW
jgi:hypothetical protein